MSTAGMCCASPQVSPGTPALLLCPWGDALSLRGFVKARLHDTYVAKVCHAFEDRASQLVPEREMKQLVPEREMNM
jgi:hypothetical protein